MYFRFVIEGFMI